MKDFTLDDIAEELSKKHPDIPKLVIRRICKHAFSVINSAIETGTARVSIRQADIMQIYKDYDRDKVNQSIMDLDETRMPSIKQLEAMNHTRKYIH
jgi:hypothetical protein